MTLDADHEPLLKRDDLEPISEHEQPKRRTLWPAFLILLGVTALACVCTYPHHKEKHVLCPKPDALKVHAPRTNLWKNLDVAEAVDLRAWLMKHAGLNLTASEDAVDSDNYIHMVESYRPPKSAALHYLATGEAKPDRYARVVVNHGSSERIVDYAVGPLPVSRNTTIRPLAENYHTFPIPLNARAAFVNIAATEQGMAFLLLPLDPILHDLFNVTVAAGEIAIGGTMPWSDTGDWRRAWFQLKLNRPGNWIQTLDFYMLIDMTGTDTATYSVLAYVHNDKLYRTLQELQAAHGAGELRPFREWDRSDWAVRSVKGARRDLDDRAGPRQVMPAGARFRVDRDEGYVTWMGWGFYLSFERDMGLHFWDIKFQNERIIYELAPQEAMAQYSGTDPRQSSTVWLDRAFGMGGAVREAIPGYDCPHHATTLNATVHEFGSTTRRNAICVFERDAGRPLSRHMGTGKDEAGAIMGYELVVRTITTVGNYDFMFDYTFQLDGTLEIRLSASGYLQGGVWKPQFAPYGHMIAPGMMGSLHDHVINYKIDFDLVDEHNSFVKLAMEQEETDFLWAELDGFGAGVQNKVTKEMITQEWYFNYAQNMEGTYVVTNQAHNNTWGNPRGYALHPGPLCHLANLDSPRTARQVNWAKHHLAVTRHHDNEPCASSMWNINLPGKPPIDFDNFVNNESLDQQDLVVWANLGTHHIPRAEDSPNTLTNIATSYLMLTPWNWGARDLSMDSRNSVLLNKKDGKWHVHEPVTQPQCASPPPPPTKYHGFSDGWMNNGTAVKPEEGVYSQQRQLGTAMLYNMLPEGGVN